MSKNNPLKTPSKMSGLTQHDIKDLVDQTPYKQLWKMFKCSSCGGTVDAVKWMWYEIGLQHGVELGKDDLK